MRLVKIDAPQETLADAMNKFITFKKADHVAPRTLRDYETYLGDFLANSSNSLDMDVLTNDVLTYFSNIPDTSPARYNHPYQNLSSFFNWAIKQTNVPLTQNPITTLGLHKKRDDGNIKPAAIEEIKTLLKSFDRSTFAGWRNYVITLVMIDTGIRTSELRRLKDDAFDAAAKQITINKTIAKTRRTRVIYLSDSTAKELEKFIKIKPAGFSDLIFPTREGSEMTCEGMSREFARQCKRAGVKITPYQFRHTFATYFAASGGDLFTLQDLMGHADIRMTRRYTELNEANKKKQHNSYSPINALQGKPRMVKLA